MIKLFEQYIREQNEIAIERDIRYALEMAKDFASHFNFNIDETASETGLMKSSGRIVEVKSNYRGGDKDFCGKFCIKDAPKAGSDWYAVCFPFVPGIILVNDKFSINAVLNGNLSAALSVENKNEWAIQNMGVWRKVDQTSLLDVMRDPKKYK